MPTILKNIKGIDFSCVSPASTAICSSTTDPPPHNPLSTIHHHRHSTSNNHYPHHHRGNLPSSAPTTPRPLHRLNTYLQDQYRNLATNLPPTTPKCISDQLLPFTPRALRKYTTTHQQQQKPVFSSSAATTAASTPVVIRRKSSADITEFLAMRRKSTSGTITTTTARASEGLIGRGRSSSSRYHLLLRDDNDDDVVDDDDNPLAIIPCEPIEVGLTTTRSSSDVLRKESSEFDRSSALVVVSQPLVKSSSHRRHKELNQDSGMGCGDRRLRLKDGRVVVKSSSQSSNIQHQQQSGKKNQVVLLKVSLHCKGCEGKLKKHLSKMQGVRSFNIDLDMKKVTVTLDGNMTSPTDLLANISRVKYAEFWPSSPSNSTVSATTWSSLSPSSSSSTTSSKSEFNNS